MSPSALRDSVLKPLWLDSPARPQARPPLVGESDVDLLVVGGGFTGLWSALRAVERNPGRSVLLVEACRIAEEASGRNGGFCEASLTHGEANGRTRWPDEYDELDRLGVENLAGIEEAVVRYGIDCDLTRGQVLLVATTANQVERLEPDAPGWLHDAAVRRILNSPTYLGGRFENVDVALLDPARLGWGLASACEQLGVGIAEQTPVLELRREKGAMVARTPSGVVRARRVVLATNAFPSLVRRLRWGTVPIYDHVLATEPLSRDQLAATGWRTGLGVADAGNRFHYYRLTPDNRILWGGYDAIYRFGRSINEAHCDRPASHELLARQFFETFPQLEGLRFTHRWAGVIDTSTQFCAYYGTAHAGKVAYALGFTGLGVGATRFAADVMLDLVDGAESERTRLRMVRKRPLPFPPEPFAWLGIKATQKALAREDATGKRGLWLSTLDRFGLGFDS